MKNLTVVKGAFIFSCAAGLCFAAPSCDDAKTQTELNICAANEYKAADKELNKV
ncbi:MAG: hypothetical protein LBF86_07240 [Helicobacteraceae bacterium]|jgi:uncharacterized protein YecT (DUF1311 family)|nr:hypothetical protein [Helicobacteraceae bacterium]